MYAHTPTWTYKNEGDDLALETSIAPEDVKFVESVGGASHVSLDEAPGLMAGVDVVPGNLDVKEDREDSQPDNEDVAGGAVVAPEPGDAADSEQVAAQTGGGNADANGRIPEENAEQNETGDTQVADANSGEERIDDTDENVSGADKTGVEAESQSAENQDTDNDPRINLDETGTVEKVLARQDDAPDFDFGEPGFEDLLVDDEQEIRFNRQLENIGKAGKKDSHRQSAVTDRLKSGSEGDNNQAPQEDHKQDDSASGKASAQEGTGSETVDSTYAADVSGSSMDDLVQASVHEIQTMNG